MKPQSSCVGSFCVSKEAKGRKERMWKRRTKGNETIKGGKEGKKKERKRKEGRTQDGKTIGSKKKTKAENITGTGRHKGRKE